jgi:molecular chaperone HscC
LAVAIAWFMKRWGLFYSLGYWGAMIIGIDLGTTNSLVGIWSEQEVVLIPNALGQFLTPSVISLGDDGQLLVGRAARERLVSHADRTAAIFKRYMGTDRQIALGKKTYRAEELSAIILRSLKADAESYLGRPVTRAVITVPAYFNDAQRKATKAAGQLAGLEVEHLLTEPTAAALAYGFTGEGEENTILVIDLGGGTLDVSLLHSFEGIMEVKATAGDTWLGGEDFTDAIAAAFMADNGLSAGDAKRLLAGSLRRQAELAKRALGNAESVTIQILLDGKPIQWTITRDRFEQLCEPLMARVRTPLERAMRDARIAPDSISRIIFAGGASRMPMFRRMASRLFRQLPLSTIDPDEVVARGAAIRAGLLEGGVGLEEHVLTDVAPFTLGVEIANRTATGTALEGMFLPIIERNSVIPLSRSHILQTIADHQEILLLNIYQGESRFVRDNVFLGKISMSVPKGWAGDEKVDVRFTYDNSGLLEVDVTVLSTKMHKNLVIEGNPGLLSKDQIRVRLAELSRLKIHPRDEAVNAAALARAARLYEENLGDVRQAIAAALDAFLAALDAQRSDEVGQARAALTQLLDSIDSTVIF